MVPTSQNFAKAFELQQEKDGTPSAFLQRFRDNMRKYSGMDPENQVAQGLLKGQFVTKSWPDIQKKIQKVDGWSEKSLEELLREAQKVFLRRKEEKQNQKAKIMVATVEQVTNKRMESESKGGRGTGMWSRGQGRG